MKLGKTLLGLCVMGIVFLVLIGILSKYIDLPFNLSVRFLQYLMGFILVTFLSGVLFAIAEEK